MDTGRWKRLEELFEAARSLEDEDRRRYLDEQCAGDADLRARVESLIAHDREDDATLRDVVERIAGGAASDDLAGAVVGSYRLVRCIGRGGMGSVWLAERDDDAFQQRVAVKFMRRDLGAGALRARFDAERRILAALQHPGIARLLDGGTTEEGRPYVVMEYVDGLPLDRYCETEGLPLERRLKLFERVCDAVDYAHRNLVVHRDLKPGNVLVDGEGAPKLLDFGIAKLLDPTVLPIETPVTGTATRLLTPEYASPEQIRGEPISTVSDVYSLGIMLYELLTGARPYGSAAHSAAALERAICESEPTRPSAAAGVTARRALRGDLDNIVLKALRKEPERRYASAGLLAEDLRRHREGLPVRAQPATLRYRAAKFVRRHRAAVAAAVVVAVSLVAATAFSLGQAVRATRAERHAAEERNIAQAINEFLTDDLLAQASPLKSPDRELTVREVLDRASDTIEERFGEQPPTEAAIRTTVMGTYKALGEREIALVHADRALELLVAEVGHRDRRAVLARVERAILLSEMPDLEKAEAALEEAVPLAREVLGDDHRKTWDAISTQAYFHADHRGREGQERAVEILAELVEMSRRVSGPDDPDHLITMNNYGSILWDLNRLDEAEPIYLEVLERRRRVLGEDHPHTLNSLNNLGTLYNRAGDGERAEPLLREALEIAERILPPNHTNVANAYTNLGAALSIQERREEALPYYREALMRAREGHPNTWREVLAFLNYGRELSLAGRREEAERMLLEAESKAVENLGKEHRVTRRVRDRLASLYDDWQRPEEAARWRDRE